MSVESEPEVDCGSGILQYVDVVKTSFHTRIKMASEAFVSCLFLRNRAN